MRFYLLTTTIDPPSNTCKGQRKKKRKYAPHLLRHHSERLQRPSSVIQINIESNMYVWSSHFTPAKKTSTHVLRQPEREKRLIITSFHYPHLEFHHYIIIFYYLHQLKCKYACNLIKCRQYHMVSLQN